MQEKFISAGSLGEFLTNCGISEDVISYIKRCFDTSEPVEKSVHDSIRILYFEYLIVGGMPEAVNTFLEI